MDRRRLLDNGYIDWLKSIGCILYLPLSYNGDLTDRISGRSLILSGNGSMVWNNAEMMYSITQPSALWQGVATLSNGLNSTWFPNDRYTSLQSVKKITNNNTLFISAGPSPITTTSENTINAIGAYYNASGRTSGFPSTLAKVAYSSEGTNGRNYYQNGSLYNHYAYYEPYLPSNWVQTSDGVAIGQVGSASRYGVSYYLKDVYLFDTDLDLTTIRKIQGL